MPDYVREILKRLESHGFSAYMVGGCVRDMLLGREPLDWDICTSAMPEEVQNLFPGSLPTGLRHGTVTVRLDGYSAEVTTYRTEQGYSDHRRPDNVRFVSDIAEDLSRRDFTINALALPLNGEILDLHGGIDDLRNGIIRCVGVPAQRFEEDALRMFRAIRFSAQLGFEIEPETGKAIELYADSTRHLAPERIKDELKRTLLSPRPELLGRMTGLLREYTHPLRDPDPLRRIDALPPGEKGLRLRWTAFCALLERDGCIVSAPEFLRALRLDSKTVNLAEQGAQIALHVSPETRLQWKLAVAEYGYDSSEAAAWTMRVLQPGTSGVALLDEIRASGECCSVAELAIDGNDLTALGLSGKSVGEMLRYLLLRVIRNPELNEPELLIELANRQLNDAQPESQEEANFR